MMKTNQRIVYEENVVKNSKIDKRYKQLFKHFLEKDYKGKKYQFDQWLLSTLCVDVDMIETDVSGDSDSTMDLAFGIAEYNDQQQRCAHHRLLLVELKLNCKSFNAIKKNELMRKDRHSRDLLSGNDIDKQSIFIFTKEVAPQAKSKKARWEKESNASIIGNWRMMDSSEYSRYIGNKEDFQTEIKIDLDLISNKIHTLFDKKGCWECIDFIEEKKKEAEYYKIQYKLNECRVLVEKLIKEIDNILQTSTLLQDDKEYFYMLKDELEALLK